MERVSVSLPEDLVSDLDGIAELVGSSRSGLIAALLQEMELGKLRTLLEAAGATPSVDPEGSNRRFRGESAGIIVAKLQRVLHPQAGLFDHVNW